MAQLDLEEVLLALRTILLTVSGLPTARVLDDTYSVVTDPISGVAKKAPYEPTPGVPYLAEQFAPGPSALETTRTCGLIEHRGLYLPTWFGVKGEGGSAIRAGVTAILAAFPPGRTVTLTSGNRLTISTNPAPSAGQIIPLEPSDHSYCQLQIPYLVDWNLSS